MQGCIKTATQSRCTMQRHKWLSMHRRNGTNGCRCTDAATPTTANARMRDSACPKFRTMRNQQSKHDVQGCTIAVAQSRCKDAATQTTAFRQPPPRHTFARSLAGCFFWCGGKRWWRDNPSVLTAEKFAI